MERLRIIVGGYIGLYPTGGATWDYIQYPLGLQMLGHDVYYIEDTGQYPIFQKEKAAWNDASYCIEYLKGIMEMYGFKGKWAYRDLASGKCFGMSVKKVKEVCSSADIFINISCSTFLRDEYLQIPKRILIDSDPMFTQIQYALEMEGSADSEKWTTKTMLENHNYLFTFGENIGASDCKIPLLGYKWHTTRQPVCLNQWQGQSNKNCNAFTSIMNWSGRKKLVYLNEEWGQKDAEFEKFNAIPMKLQETKFEVVVNKPLNKESSLNEIALKELGWKVLDPSQTVATASEYRDFIFNSKAEFGVAKETYVKANTGWFSGRSACYLAAGKPVIAEETQWSKFINTGNGLFAFSNMEEAKYAIEEVQANYDKHSMAATEIAHQYFDSSRVLTRMLEKLND